MLLSRVVTVSSKPSFAKSISKLPTFTQPNKIRRYATESKKGQHVENLDRNKLLLTFCTPAQVFHKDKEVKQVRVPSTGGEFGILAKHVPTIAELKPGVVTVILNDKDNKEVKEQYFVPGGFAMVHEDSTASVNVPEAYPLDAFDIEIVKENLKKATEESQKSNDLQVKAIATIALEVNQALLSSLQRSV